MVAGAISPGSYFFFYRLPTNCVHRPAANLLRIWIQAISTHCTSCRPVPFNKIMPAGEHMAVQNFITPFMAFQHYDVGLQGAGTEHRFLSANIYWCQRERVVGSEVERSVAEGSEVVGSRWQGVGVWYVLVFKTRSSAINSPASKRLTRSGGDAFDQQRVTYVSQWRMYSPSEAGGVADRVQPFR